MAPRRPILRAYALQICKICPKLQPVEILVRQFRSPCTGFEYHHLTFPIMCTAVTGGDATEVCQIYEELPLWNELLAFLNMELTEIAPGRLNAARLPEANGTKCKPQVIERAAVCLHWLLVEHKCVERIEPSERLLDNYPQLFIDALARSSSVKSVALSRQILDVDVAIDLFTRTSQETRLEELELDNITFLGNSSKLQYSLVRWIRNLPSLKSLKVTSMHVSWNADLFAYAVKFDVGIAKLTVDTHLVEGEKKLFSAFVASTTVLTELVLVGRGFQASREADSVLEALGRNSVLRKVSFHRYSFDVLEVTQLSDALAASKTLEEVAFLCCYWEVFTHRIHEGKIWRARVTNAKCRWGLWWRVDPFVHAIRKSMSLRKLHIDTNHFRDDELTRLLEAVQDSNFLKELRFDLVVRPSAGEFWSLIQDSGASEKVTIAKCSSKSELLVDWLHVLPTWTSIEGHTFYHLSSTHMLNICAALSCHDHISTLHLIMDTFLDAVSEQCAFSVAFYLASTATLKEVHLHFRATDEAVHIITDAVSKNTSLETIRIQGWYLRRHDAFTICDWLLQSRTLHRMIWLCRCAQKTLEDMLWKLSKSLHDCYSLTSLVVDDSWPANARWQQVKNIIRRNSSLVDRAAHFVLGARTKICACAFELVSSHPLVLPRVKEIASLEDEEVHQRLREAEQDLQTDFWSLSGVVKEELSCENLDNGRTQIDQLGMDAWLTIRKFLKVSDVADAKQIVTQKRTPKSIVFSK